MDFNTGGREPDDRPLFGEETGGSPGGYTGGPSGGPERGPVRGSGGEFNLQDPVGSFISTLRDVLLSPVNFFRAIARRGDFVNPLVFALICSLISALLGGILGLLISPLTAPAGGTGEALAGGVVGFVVSLFLTPIFTAVGLFIGAAITHLLVLLFVRPGNSGFEATFRVGAYVSAIQLISWIPIVNIVAFIYGIVLSILGIREVHDTTTGRAAAIILIPVAVILFFVILLVVLLGTALLFFAGENPQQF